MRLQKIVNRLQRLHPKEIDLSLIRIKKLCKKLGNPQDKIKAISVIGTNGKNSTINAIFSILKEANFKCNVYTSPHILNINERFVFDNKELNNNELANLFEEVEKINDNEEITFFEILTACYFYKAAQYPDNINIIEAGLFFRFDATNILKKNLATVITSISKDHLDWLPVNQRTIKKIVFEKTSSLLNSNIIVAKQNTKNTMNYIKKSLSENLSNKVFFDDNFKYSKNGNDFFFYEDKLGELKLPMPNILGQFQLENISTAVAMIRTLKLNVKNRHIQKGIKKIKNIGRLQEIYSGKMKDLIKNNRLLLDGSHNEDGSRVLNEFLDTLSCKKHIIIGMMANKDHKKYINHFKNISSLTTINIPNQPNAFPGQKLKKKFSKIPNVKFKENIEQALKSLSLDDDDLVIITGSLYLTGEFLNMN